MFLDVIHNKCHQIDWEFISETTLSLKSGNNLVMFVFSLTLNHHLRAQSTGATHETLYNISRAPPSTYSNTLRVCRVNRELASWGHLGKLYSVRLLLPPRLECRVARLLLCTKVGASPRVWCGIVQPSEVQAGAISAV